MFIQTESTPNPNSLKFLVSGKTAANETIQYTSSESSPKFIENIFKLGRIESVYVTSSFITVTKNSSEEWDYLKVQILEILFEDELNVNESSSSEDAQRPVVTDEIPYEDLDEISKEIFNLIEERVTPAVAMDGGEISFIKFDKESGVVYLKLKGSCQGCPSSSITLQNGIKNMLMHYVPEVKEVEAI